MRRLARVPKGYSSTVVSSKLSGDQMAHQARKGLPEPGDFRAGSWRDVVGLLMAFNRVGPDSRHDAAGDVVA
jgi:hypothetical protein